MNKDSLRSWLAFLAFVFLYIPSTQLELLIAQPIVQAIGLVLGPFSGAPAHEVPPERLIGLCIIRVILVVAIMAIAARVDRRPMLSYGLDPIRLPEIAHGLLVGFLAVTAVVCGLYLSGHLHLTRGDGNIASRLLFGPIWAIGMILVGFSEELEFRGLPLLVLARVTSPAVACIVSAATFTLAHVQNSDETALGLLQIALFGGIAAISVMATGRLMWCIALHASWDWTLETFFWGYWQRLSVPRKLFQGRCQRSDLAYRRLGRARRQRPGNRRPIARADHEPPMVVAPRRLWPRP